MELTLSPMSLSDPSQCHTVQLLCWLLFVWGTEVMAQAHDRISLEGESRLLLDKQGHRQDKQNHTISFPEDSAEAHGWVGGKYCSG